MIDPSRRERRDPLTKRAEAEGVGIGVGVGVGVGVGAWVSG